MMNLTLTILIDDDDRDQCPDTPYTATLASTSDDEHCYTSGGGVGATPQEALVSLLDMLEVSEQVQS